MKKFWPAIITVCISQAFTCCSTYVILNQIEPFIICWLHVLKYGQSEIRSEITKSLVSTNSTRPTEDDIICESAFDLYNQGFLDKTLKTWFSIRMIYGWSAAVSSLLAQTLIDKFGRVKVMVFNSVINTISCLILIILPFILKEDQDQPDQPDQPDSDRFRRFNTAATLFSLGQVLSGLNCGLAQVINYLYLIEISQVHKRGFISSLYMTFGTIGMLITYTLGVSHILGRADTWSLIFIIPLVSGCFMFFVCLVPETPSFYKNVGKLDKADEMKKELYGEDWDTVVLDLSKFSRRMQNVSVSDANGNTKETLTSYLSLYKEILNNPDLLSTTIYSIILMFFTIPQQLVGAVYSSIIFTQFNIDRNITQYFIVGTGAIRIIFQFFSGVLMEKYGRKKPMMIGFLVNAVVMFGFCGVTLELDRIQDQNDHQNDDQKLKTTLIIIFCTLLLIMLIAHNMGYLNPIFAFSAEALPTKYKSTGQAISTCACYVFTGLLSFLIPFLVNEIKGYTFVIFGVTNVLAVGFIKIYIPEVGGRRASDTIRRVSQRAVKRRESLQTIGRKLSLR